MLNEYYCQGSGCQTVSTEVAHRLSNASCVGGKYRYHVNKLL